MNTENDGALTLPELLFIVGYMKVMLVCELLFLAADVDGSGVLEPAELKECIKLMKERNGLEPPTESEMDAIIEKKLGGKSCTFHIFAKHVVPKILKAYGVEFVAAPADADDDTEVIEETA